MNKNYQILLKHPLWFEKRVQILKRDNNKCINCGGIDKLQVHHRQYHFSKTSKTFAPPWNYKNKYLITLCNNCHNSGHKIHKTIPTFIIK
jgi:hypothetical protein